MRSRRPSAIEVARLAGVSQSAVSRAFTPGASISPATRAKVMSAAEQIGYMPNAIARSMITRRTNIIGVVLGNLEYQFYQQALRVLSLRLQEAGRQVLLFTVPPGGTVPEPLVTVGKIVRTPFDDNHRLDFRTYGDVGRREHCSVSRQRI